MKRYISFISIGLLISCQSRPNTPEEVVVEFATLLSTGKCEEAMEYCHGNAKEIVQGSIDAGCDPYETIIDSASCEVNGDKATCTCYETRPFGSIEFPYTLEKMDGQWMILENSKDIGMDSEEF